MNMERGDRAELIQAILDLRRENTHLNRIISCLRRYNTQYKKELGRG